MFTHYISVSCAHKYAGKKNLVIILTKADLKFRQNEIKIAQLLIRLEAKDLLSDRMALVAECYQLVRGFWKIVEASKFVEINKHQPKTLADRRNHIMETIQNTVKSDAAKSRLEEFDKMFITILNKFNRKYFMFKMLFNKSDKAQFKQLTEDLDNIVRDFPDLTVLDGDKFTEQQNKNDIIHDFKHMKEYFVAHVIQATLADKVEVKSNLQDYLPELKDFAASTVSAPTSVFTSTLSALDLPSVDDDIDALTSALSDVTVTVPAAPPIPALPPIPVVHTKASVVEEPPAARLRTETADERGPFLASLEAWFMANVSSVKPSKRKEYAQHFYDNNFTTETRILTQLTRNPKWLSQHDVDEFDAEDILAYLRTKGLPSTAPPIGRRSSTSYTSTYLVSATRY